MASELQIAANRRNAQKSTGPKTADGKKRSSKNAYRHGLSLPMSKVGSPKQREDLARQFAGDASDARILCLAERAADSKANVVRVRTVKTEILERGLMQTQGDSPTRPALLDSSRPLLGGNEEEEEQFVNAVRHVLPELTRISRYEMRAVSQLNRDIHALAFLKNANKR